SAIVNNLSSIPVTGPFGECSSLYSSLYILAGICVCDKHSYLNGCSISLGTEETCGRCPTGWLLLKTSCYYFSHHEINSRKNWTESRQYCINQGGDLLVINNLEDHNNIRLILAITH
uniref:C-type lectin domain-containing protein n=1 Tax=Pundamilia nyererei TaxID=303518 RepID=A0A3B4H8Q8_9CICH